MQWLRIVDPIGLLSEFSGCAAPCETSCRVDFGSTVLGFLIRGLFVGCAWLCLEGSLGGYESVFPALLSSTLG